MTETRIFILCSARIAIPSVRNLVMARQLAFVAIPEHCTELIEEMTGLLQPLGIPVLTVDKDNFAAKIRKAIAEYKANLGFVITFSFKIPQQLVTLPQKGFFNVHPGPLPEYRGADPVFQQIKNRETHAGVTIHRLAEKMDTGAVLIRQMIKLSPEDTYGIVDANLGELAASMIGTVMKMIALEIDLPVKVQDELKARYFKRQERKDILINWDNMEAAAIIALINACNPWNKGAVTVLNNKIIRLLSAVHDVEMDTGSVSPGTITEANKNFIAVAVKPAGVLKIDYFYLDEGFLHANALVRMGIQKGGRFMSL